MCLCIYSYNVFRTYSVFDKSKVFLLLYISVIIIYRRLGKYCDTYLAQLVQMNKGKCTLKWKNQTQVWPQDGS